MISEDDMRDVRINRNETALLLIDIQNDYFPGGLFELYDSEQASEVAMRILDVFRKNDFEIIHIRHIANTPFGSFFKKNTFGSEIHEKVKPVENERVFIKHFVSSFYGTGLLKYLKAKKIKNLAISGMQTNVCVTGAAKDARKKGFNVLVINDACAARSEEIHGKQINYLKKYAEVVSSDEIISMF
jgi:nicotinamidase-related amidase